ncbi:MAG: hypothetical protein K6E40_02155 [Desulfovibrio sp.]|nr:hypothetical protein [Desulfovibrio sp.]
MITKSRLVQVWLPEETLADARRRAQAEGRTLSSFLRMVALRQPVALPRCRRIAGIEAMLATGRALGHAVRGEAGRCWAEVPGLLRQLHGRIMALLIEETEAPARVPATFWRRAPEVADGVPRERMRLVAFRCTAAEEAEMRWHAVAYGLPLSTCIRRRLQGQPLQPRTLPLEGLPAVIKAVALLRHVAGFKGAGAEAWRLAREAEDRRWQLEKEATHDH